MRTKVTLIVFAASIVTFIIAESLTIKGEYVRHNTKIYDLTVSSAQLISDYCGLLLLNKTPESLQIGVDDFSRLPFVYDAIVVDNNGKILVEYHKSQDTITHQIFNCNKNVSCIKNGYIHVLIPITFNSETFGKLYVRSYIDTQTLRNELIVWTLVIICIQILFAFFIINLFHRYISNPLSHLKNLTRKIIDDKNYNLRIEKKSFDEIGELYDEFNNLLDTIDVYGQKSSYAETELIESNERYKTLVDNIPGVVFRLIHDNKWNIDLLGEGVVELTDGLTVDFFLGKDVSVMALILAPESKELLFERILNSVGVNREFESTYKVITKTGRQKWILMRGRFVYNSENNKTTVDGILFDQTEKIIAQELLKKTEKRYHDLFENLNDAAFLVDIETDFIVETNKEGEKLLGLERKYITSKLKRSVLCRPLDSSQNGNNENTLFTLFDFYAEIIHSSGKNIPVHVRSSIIAIGEKDHLLCLVRDISERMEYEHNLKIAKEKAEESDNLKSMFLSNMSHEIRTPLNGFIGFSKLILESKSAEETKGYISIIDGCGKQLLRIIDDILDVSRIETGQMTFYNEEFSINALLDDIKSIIEEQIRKANKSTISVNLSKGLFDQNDIICTDKNRLYQVIVNIASNAVKFTEQGTISISYKPLSEGRLEFKISDTGMGIESDKKEIIFNRFTQANNSIAVKYGGSGLGLSISKGIVSLMGGEIWLDTEVSKGSIFYFTIKQNKINNDS